MGNEWRRVQHRQHLEPGWELPIYTETTVKQNVRYVLICSYLAFPQSNELRVTAEAIVRNDFA